jgi:3-phosphoshikimate 1-carboxyvinyltransferase
LQVPGDKSISHRALMFSLLADGECHVSRLSPAQDCQSTIACLRALGVTIEADRQIPGEYILHSRGVDRLQTPRTTLDAGNSGTTIRLLSGLLSGSPITCTLDGDSSLRSRPMARVLNPLAQMGAQFTYLQTQGCPPFSIKGGTLQGRRFTLQVASAQVQTALLLAGLHADGETVVELPAPVRDHTERMLRFIGVPFNQSNQSSSSNALWTGVKKLSSPVPAYSITVAGDISSAAFFMVAAACTPGSDITLTNVGMNSGRTLVIAVLQEMGAEINVLNDREVCGEPVADIRVRGTGTLAGTLIAGDRIAAGIDELPILALAGALCKGTFAVRDAQELRVKESDRLSAITGNLTRAGANVVQFDDGFEIKGTGMLPGGSQWSSFADHRMAMTGMVASLLCQSPLCIDDIECAAVSYPQFNDDLQKLVAL